MWGSCQAALFFLFVAGFVLYRDRLRSAATMCNSVTCFFFFQNCLNIQDTCTHTDAL